MCAIVGMSLPHGNFSAIQMTVDSLRKLQHRGQDGTGLFADDTSGGIQGHKGLGLVVNAFPEALCRNPASAAVGHTRYATQGQPTVENLQPHLARCRDGWLVLASNGDLPYYREYRQALAGQGVELLTDNDGELLVSWLARLYDRGLALPDAIRKLQSEIDGAYSAVVLLNKRVFAFRDRHGFRPMALSRLPHGGVVFASEELAFDIHLAEPSGYEPISAGAILEADQGQLTVHEAGHQNQAACLFELMYFARPDGYVFDVPVSLFRRRSGWRLGRMINDQLDLTHAVVAAVPDSSNEMAAGVADVLGLPFVPALLRSHDSGRTFITNEQRMRDEGVRLKYNPDGWLVEGRDMVLVDDSVVRGTTMHRIARMLRRRGARRVWLLVGSPPVRWPCFMGIATPTKAELIASHQSVEDIGAYLGVDGLTYLSIEDSVSAAGQLLDWEYREFSNYLGPRSEVINARLVADRQRTFCTACFTGQYPIRLPE